jgi:hypothetical protein
MSKEVKDPKNSHVDEQSINPQAAHSFFVNASPDGAAFGGAAFGGAASRRPPTPSTPPIQPAEAGGDMNLKDSKVENLQSLEEFQNQIKELTDKVTKLTEVVNSQLTQNASPVDLASLEEKLALHNIKIQLLLEETTRQDTLIYPIQPQLYHQEELIHDLQRQIDGIKEGLYSLSDRHVTSARKIDGLAERVSKRTGAKGPEDDTISSSQFKPLPSNASDSSASKDPQSGASQALLSGELNLSASQASQLSRADRLKRSATKALKFFGLLTPEPLAQGAVPAVSYSKRGGNPKPPNPQSPNPPEALQNSSQKEYYIVKVEKEKSYHFRTRNVEFIIPFDNIKKEFNYDDYDNRQLFADELRGLFIKFSEENKPDTKLTDDVLMRNFKDFFSIHKFNFDFTRTHFEHNPPDVNSPEDIREFIKFFINLKSQIDKNQAATYSSSDHDLVTQPSSPSLSPSGNRRNTRLLESNSPSNSPSPARLTPSPLEASIEPTEPTKSCGR